MSDVAIAGLAAGLALAVGVEPWRIGILVLALVMPVVVGSLVVWLVFRRARQDDNRAALFAEGVAGELRAGAVLGEALPAAARAVGLQIGRGSIESLTDDIANQVSGIGPELRSAVSAAANSGSRVADLFDEIGAVAIAQAEASREVRVATAPARATAAVFGGAPAIYLFVQTRGGGLASLMSSPGQQVSGLLGLGLFLTGLAAVLTILWRAS